MVVRVLESLRLYLPTYTLANLSAEIKGWWNAGQSCFTKLLKEIRLQTPIDSVLRELLPVPDG
jgi:hypothetical protein